MEVVSKLVNSRVNQFFVRNKVSIVEENLAGFRLIKPIDLLA
jgi:hypothetical protein